MDGMLEKVKRAIINAWVQDESETPDQLYERMARAAIEAMREPTEGMLRHVLAEETRCYCNFNHADTWRTMVDAALSPAPHDAQKEEK